MNPKSLAPLALVLFLLLAPAGCGKSKPSAKMISMFNALLFEHINSFDDGAINPLKSLQSQAGSPGFTKDKAAQEIQKIVAALDKEIADAKTVDAPNDPLCAQLKAKVLEYGDACKDYLNCADLPDILASRRAITSSAALNEVNARQRKIKEDILAIQRKLAEQYKLPIQDTANP